MQCNKEYNSSPLQHHPPEKIQRTINRKLTNPPLSSSPSPTSVLQSSGRHSATRFSFTLWRKSVAVDFPSSAATLTSQTGGLICTNYWWGRRCWNISQSLINTTHLPRRRMGSWVSRSAALQPCCWGGHTRLLCSPTLCIECYLRDPHSHRTSVPAAYPCFLKLECSELLIRNLSDQTDVSKRELSYKSTTLMLKKLLTLRKWLGNVEIMQLWTMN